MKKLYNEGCPSFWKLTSFKKLIAVSIVLVLISGQAFAQPCPTPSLSAPPVCEGQPVNLILNVTPPPAGPYTVLINGVTYNNVVPGTPFPVQGATEETFYGNTVPPIFPPDLNPYELGVRFRPTQNGFIKGIRFYKDALATGPFTGTLWTNTGTALATGTFSTTASGWQTLTFSAPVPVTAGTLYVASYYAPTGIYPFASDAFTSGPVTSSGGLLVAPQSGVGEGDNGLYRAGSSGFPTETFNNSNYFVDVVFQPSSGVVSSYSLTAISAIGCATFPVVGVSTTVTINPLPSGVLTSPTGEGDAGQPPVLGFTPGTGTAPYSLVINGTNVSNVNPPTTFNGPSIPSIIQQNIFSGSLPTPTAGNDGQPGGIEAGNKFRASQDGFITALRFYKAVADAEPTVLKLYDGTGTLVRSVTHQNSGQSGFIQLPIPSYAVTEGTVYIVSYYSAVGNYAYTNGFFRDQDYVNDSLTAPSNSGADGPNGLYTYGSAIPATSCVLCQGPNYWADVEFRGRIGSYDLNLTQITDANGCSVAASQVLNLNVNSPLPVTFSKFTASVVNQDDVQLEWTTASESNNKGFEVQRSEDAVKWSILGFVNGAGTSETSRNYSFTDLNRPAGKFLYRLKQVDFDNKFKFSNILPVEINGRLSFELNQNFPNPVRGLATITYSIPERANVRIVIYDAQGRVVTVLQNGERTPGKYAITVPETMLRKGIYYYKMEAGSFRATKKMIVQ